MGHHHKHWSQQGWGGGWAYGPGPRGRGRGGPPPWLAGIFGMEGPDQRRGPRVRRGDVRSAILDVLREAGEAEETINGYQVIQQIADKSNGAWRPSPGSVYPTIQQLQDEGLVEEDVETGRRSLRLTRDGRRYVDERLDELAGVWTPFDRERDRRAGEGIDFGDVKQEIGQVMSAVWQIISQGSDQQRRAAVDILVDTRRRLYGVLAEGPEADSPEEEELP